MVIGDLNGDGKLDLATANANSDNVSILLNTTTCADTDGDGLPDYWESQYGLPPNDPADAGQDDDNDSFTNLEEFTGGTNPQNNLSVPNSTTTLDGQSQPIRLVVPSGVVVTGFQWIDPATLPPPSGTFPYGLVSINVQVPNPGDTITVALTFPGAVSMGSTYYKYGPTTGDPTNHWYAFPLGSDDGDATITLTLTDGGAGDHDLTVNGMIDDPGGPFVPTASKLINISSRARVLTGDNVMIGGFIIDGTRRRPCCCGRGGRRWAGHRSSCRVPWPTPRCSFTRARP